jgi:hypothetical protein
MGAVSGDINTGPMACVDDLDLASRPVASKKSGDLAWLASKAGTPEGQLFFLDRDSVLVVDGVGVLTALGGVGRWLSVKFYGTNATLSVATISDLAAIDDLALLDGTQVYVQSLRDVFFLRTEVVAPDGITIVAALSTLKTWFRGNTVSFSWDSTSDWYVDADPLVGDDENDGGTPGTPLATLEELMRRTYRPESPRATGFSVHVGAGGAGTPDTKWVQNVDVEFFGEETEVSPYVAITAVTAFSRTGAYVPQSVTAAIAWTPENLLRVRDSVGASKLRGWMTRTGGAGVGITKLFTAGLAFTDPTVGPPADEIGEFSLPIVRGQFTALAGAYLGFYTCHVQAAFFGCDNTYLEACYMNADFYQCGETLLQECYIQALILKSSYQTDLQACVIKGLVRLYDSKVLASADTSVVGNNIATNCGFKVYSGGSLRLYGDGIEFYNSAIGIEIPEPSGFVDCNFTPVGAAPGTGYVYGASNDVIMDVSKTGAYITYNNKAALVAAATTAQWRHLAGAGTGAQTSGAFAALPSAAAIITAMTGIFPSN